MKIIKMKGLVEAAHGKICQDDNNSVSYRKKDGKMFSMRICNPRDLKAKPYTEAELKIHRDFTQNGKTAGAWIKANRKYKPKSRTIDLAASSEDYRKMRAAYDAQDAIPNFMAFVWKQVKNGVVVVPDVELDESAETPSGNGGTSTTPSGNGGTSGGSTPSGNGGTSTTPSGNGGTSGDDEMFS